MAKTNPIQVQKFLGGLNYPVRKEDLIQHARDKGADDNVIATLDAIPDEEFETPADVSKAIGQAE